MFRLNAFLRITIFVFFLGFAAFATEGFTPPFGDWQRLFSEPNPVFEQLAREFFNEIYEDKVLSLFPK